MVRAMQGTARGGRRHGVARASVRALLSAGVVCCLAACSWGEEPPEEGAVTGAETTTTPDDTASPSDTPSAEPTQTPDRRRGGGGSGGSPVLLATAAQELDNPFLEVHARFVEQMTVNCGGTLCVTVLSEPPDADSTCTYQGSDPPWEDGGLTVARGSTVVLLADCSPATSDPGEGSGGDDGGQEDGGTGTGTSVP
jgi:hypothetical protein